MDTILFLAFLTVVFVGIGDTVSTMYASKRFGLQYEANPIIKKLYSVGGWYTIFTFKIGVSIFAALGICLLPDYNIKVYGLSFLTVFGISVTFSNIYNYHLANKNFTNF